MSVIHSDHHDGLPRDLLLHNDWPHVAVLNCSRSRMLRARIGQAPLYTVPTGSSLIACIEQPEWLRCIGPSRKLIIIQATTTDELLGAIHRFEIALDL